MRLSSSGFQIVERHVRVLFWGQRLLGIQAGGHVGIMVPIGSLHAVSMNVCVRICIFIMHWLTAGRA